MAPLGLDNQLNISSLAATWLGALFTGIGLLAVFSQLRSKLLYALGRHEEMVGRATGKWVSCIDVRHLPDEGILEEAAPALAGWIQKFYVENKPMKLTQSDRRIAGTSTWSKLFSQAGIFPDALMICGEPSGRILPVGSDVSRAPIQADISMDKGRLLYGFTSAEFAALLVITGFPPTAFHERGASSSTNYLGTLRITDYNAFSQVAFFDSHGGTKIMEVEKERLVHSVPVRGSIHVALGILQLVPHRRNRKWIIIPSHLTVNRLSSGGSGAHLEAWMTLPRATLLNSTRYNIEQLVGCSGGDIISYNVQSKSDESEEVMFIQSLLGPDHPCHRKRQRAALLAAYAIDALEPWALLPVAPQHLIDALSEILEPFVASREETVDFLCRKLISCHVKVPSGWKTSQELADSLARIGDLKTEYFCKSANYCAYYYDAMILILNANQLPLSHVRKALAAAVSWYIFFPATPPFEPEKEDEEKSDRRQKFSAMLAHLHGYTLGSMTINVRCPDWAIKVYAAYLWAWLNDSCLADDDFLRFQRRVFLA